jgi:hypothetical protein
MRPRKIVGSYLAEIYQGRTINVGSNHSLLYFTYWLPNTSLKARVTGLPALYPESMAQAYPLSHILWVLNSAKVLRTIVFSGDKSNNLCSIAENIIGVVTPLSFHSQFSKNEGVARSP